MHFSTTHQRQFIQWLLLLFYGLAIFYFFSGLWMFQNVPFVFKTRFDGTLWLFMLSGFHQWLLHNFWGCVLMDVLFYGLPAVYGIVFFTKQKLAPYIAALMLPVNWIYWLTITIYPTFSLEGHIGWLLMPLLLMCLSVQKFYTLMHALRYVFVFFFFTAGLWKVFRGSVFDLHQMSGVLLDQHKDSLAVDTGWYANMIYWVIQHPAVGSALYVAGTVAELVFIIAFFTRKYDRTLLLVFFSFLLLNFLLMKIPYFILLPMALTMFFSNKKEPLNEKVV